MLRLVPPVAAPASLDALRSGLLGSVRPAATSAAAGAAVCEGLGVSHAFLLSSGRAALTLILRALRRASSRTRVILPAYTCFSVPAAVVRAGLEPVPCDVNPDTLDFDFAHLETLLAPEDALCVISTHLLGLPADVSRVVSTCRRRGVLVIEDAAQAFGFRSDNAWLGTTADIGFYSLGRGKPLDTGGGGIIVTNDAALADLVSAEFQTLGPSACGFRALLEVIAASVLTLPRLYWMPARLPFLHLGETHYSTDFAISRITGAQAGLLIGWRERIVPLNNARQRRVSELAHSAAHRRAFHVTVCLRVPFLCRSTNERDRLWAVSRRRGLGLGPLYPTAINRIPQLADSCGRSTAPGADDLAGRLLTIPIHPRASMTDIRKMKDLLEEITS